MISAINLAKSNINFRIKEPVFDGEPIDESHIKSNTLKTRTEQNYQKITSAFIDYPVKGLKGDKNSDFYEFLTMGIVPYLIGSAMFMVVFNALNIGKHLGVEAKRGSAAGKKMALGVILYGVLKNISPHLVTKPVKAFTGVDTELPYANKVYNLPKGAGEDADLQVTWQQRKVYDSKEFYRKDLLKREYFDYVAEKLGLGENLKDSVTETSPIIQNIVATSNLAKNISSYCWAAVGVALASQDSWLDFFDSISNRKAFINKNDMKLGEKFVENSKILCENTWNITKNLAASAVKSSKELWNGSPAHKGFMKHSGKALVSFASLMTILLTTNSIVKAKNMAKNNNLKTIDENKESTVI